MHCAATTKAGLHCVNKALLPGIYCGIHNKSVQVMPAPRNNLHNLPPPSGDTGCLTLGKVPPDGAIVVCFSSVGNGKYLRKGFLCEELSFAQLQIPAKNQSMLCWLRESMLDCKSTNSKNILDRIGGWNYFVVPEVQEEAPYFNKVAFRKFIMCNFTQAVWTTQSFIILQEYLQKGGHLHFPYPHELSSDDPEYLEKLIDLTYDPEHFPQVEFLLFLFLVLPKEDWFWSNATTTRY